MESRIRIDLEQGVVEASGSEDFVRSVYSDFKESVADRRSTPAKSTGGAAGVTPKKASESHVPTRTKSTERARKRESYSRVTELDLYGGSDVPSLKAFVEQFNLKNNMERNLVFVAYLQETVGVDQITLDHLYTCYDHLGLRVPKVDQSVIDTARRKGWITSSFSDITVTLAGQNALRHELEKANDKSPE